MNKIFYYDLGVYQGTEIDRFIEIMSQLNLEYEIHGFEALPKFYNALKNKYEDKKNVHIHNLIIGSETGQKPLYLSNIPQGHSIYRSKTQCTDKFVMVDSVKFTDFVGEKFKTQKNIIKFNIEGAEWDLVRDIVSKGYEQYISLWLGADIGCDILKCKEIAHHYKEYVNILKKKKIKMHRFCENAQEKSEDIVPLIKRVAAQ